VAHGRAVCTDAPASGTIRSVVWSAARRLPPPAAVALVRRGPRILTVSRHYPPYELTLPGGEVDRGETPARAALRELYEETGIVGRDPSFLWVGRSPTDRRTVYVFDVPRWRGVAYPREWLPVAWLLPWQLLAQGVEYASFNADVLRAVA
jgi:8-oxo-dGTP pyrophosphatase MutT (NUDIX family)